jgi:hypothetical protein
MAPRPHHLDPVTRDVLPRRCRRGTGGRHLALGAQSPPRASRMGPYAGPTWLTSDTSWARDRPTSSDSVNRPLAAPPAVPLVACPRPIGSRPNSPPGSPHHRRRQHGHEQGHHPTDGSGPATTHRHRAATNCIRYTRTQTCGRPARRSLGKTTEPVPSNPRESLGATRAPPNLEPSDRSLLDVIAVRYWPIPGEHTDRQAAQNARPRTRPSTKRARPLSAPRERPRALGRSARRPHSLAAVRRLITNMSK